MITSLITVIELVITLNVTPSDTIMDVKRKIDAKDGTPASRMGLTWQAQLLVENTTVQEYGIEKEDTLHVYLRWPQATHISVLTRERKRESCI